MDTCFGFPALMLREDHLGRGLQRGQPASPASLVSPGALCPGGAFGAVNGDDIIGRTSYLCCLLSVVCATLDI